MRIHITNIPDYSHPLLRFAIEVNLKLNFRSKFKIRGRLGMCVLLAHAVKRSARSYFKRRDPSAGAARRCRSKAEQST